MQNKFLVTPRATIQILADNEKMRIGKNLKEVDEEL
jgi:hypothetical protein